MATKEPIRVLIVEDDLRISELHRRFTEKIDGFEVVGIANTIADAEDMAEVLAPDLVLLDLFFPEGNGLDLLRKLRARAVPADVILITAAREMNSLKEAIRGGVFDYNVKPVVLTRFQASMERYRDYFRSMRAGGSLDQKDIDRLFHPEIGRRFEDPEMPKGIDRLTLRKIRQVFESSSDKDFSAEEVAEQIGLSRSTARRYLEYLVSESFLAADLLYGVVGRPERRYFRVT
ncbi:response regulator [Syntrophobacter fumaroxidans]|uniref:Transcriptional regulatory protein n=1 Tax=Syntrophobacter fumaroxidans (strain DSM 10017 / MPOB) TaxID=335543 RepID=A0LQF7_SYNFM|nr:response regulator [Syntrophobacter fumaroxidans]ABK19659.1 response regulator receiver and unknown domain protein [Syntrophobacter fumaroxidans MPOB]